MMDCSEGREKGRVGQSLEDMQETMDDLKSM